MFAIRLLVCLLLFFLSQYKQALKKNTLFSYDFNLKIINVVLLNQLYLSKLMEKLSIPCHLHLLPKMVLNHMIHLILKFCMIHLFILESAKKLSFSQIEINKI